jgi:hypothetical protein
VGILLQQLWNYKKKNKEIRALPLFNRSGPVRSIWRNRINIDFSFDFHIPKNRKTRTLPA